METRGNLGLVYGHCVSTVTRDHRIRIGKPLLPLLKDQDVKRVWLCTLPDKAVLIFCPEPSWNKWIEDVQAEFPVLRTAEGLRAYLALSDQVGFESKGRIFVAQNLLKHAGLQTADVVEVFGMGDYLEIWKARPVG